jgi:hypothetical protein
MKNTLAENMLRFGVKNLKESDVKKIEEALLIEAIDLTKDPNLTKAFASIKAQTKKGIKQPMALMGFYLIMFNQPQDFQNAVQVNGKVLAFQAMPWTKIGNLPCLPDYTVGFGGNFSWKLDEPTPYSIEMDYTIPQFGNITAADVAKTINQTLSPIPVATLQAMYNAHPNKAKYDAAIAAFKANATGKQVLAGLTGNAKAFYGV